MLSFDDALNHIENLEKFGSVPGLDNIRQLMNSLENPQDNLRVIHITGTNGKGSTSQFIAAGLIKQGFKVGVFSSPSIKDYRERYKVNGEMISQEDFAKISEEIINKRLHCTEFEFSTAIAFVYFYMQKCDYVVLEVGMGGLLDSTNIIKTTEVAVLTPISLDHTHVLGNSLEKITHQKCGIIKANSKVVSAVQPKEVENIIKSYDHSVKFTDEAEILSTSTNGTEFTYNNKNYKIKLLGMHQVQNACIAIDALNLLGVSHPNLDKAFIPYRFQQIESNLFYDAAHNVAGATVLASCIDLYLPNKNITIIMGMLADKDYSKCIEILAEKASKFVALTPNSNRALPREQLAKIAQKYCGNVIIGSSIDYKPEDDEIAICCGSFTIYK